MSGGINEEMSEKEAIRKKNEAEEKAKEEEERRQKALGPNFPKVWDLNYFREDTQKIFKKLSSDKLDWDFFDFPIYPHEESYFTSNFYENLDELKWENKERILENLSLT